MRTLTRIFIFVLLFCACSAGEQKLCGEKQSGYLVPGCFSGYASDIALIYITDFAGNEMNWVEEEFLPYLNFVDENYATASSAKMFDTLLILSGARNVNGVLHSFSNKYETGYPSDIEDWQWIIAKMFDYPEYGLNALDSISGKLGMETKIIILIPYPDREQKLPGFIDGKKLDFSILEDRITAVKYWIDSVINNWIQKSYSNLHLIGFYWMNEVMSEFFGIYGDNLDENLLENIRDYLHSVKVNNEWMRLFWIPSNLSFVVEDTGMDGTPWMVDSRGKEIFDAIIFQTNYMQGFYEWRSYKTLEEVAEVADRYGFGVEMEFNECIYFDEGCLARSIEYFDAGERYGFKNSVQAYVFGNTQISRMVREKFYLYEKIYRYINDI